MNPIKFATPSSAVLRRITLAAAMGAICLAGSSQTVPTPEYEADKEDKEKEITKLDPYSVSTSVDKGYYTEASTAGARYNKNLFDIAGSMGIINRELIADLAAVDLNKPLLLGVSGITQQRRTETNFTIRGFRSLGALRNGTRFPTANLRASTFDTERIEVIKGPAAMITGINSSGIGGIVNVITRMPTETLQGSFNVTASDHSYLRFAGNLSGPIFKSDDFKALYRVTLGNTSGDTPRAIESIEDSFLGGALQFKFGKNTSINLEGFWYDRGGYEYFAAQLDHASRLAGRAEFAKDFPVDIEKYSPGRAKDVGIANIQGVVSAEATHTFNPVLSMRMKYAYAQDDNKYRVISGAGYNSMTFLQNRTYVNTWSLLKADQVQLDMLANFETGILKHEVSSGYDYDRSNSWSKYYLVAALDPVDVRNPNFSGDDAKIAAVMAARPPRQEENRVLASTASWYVQEYISFWQDKIALVGGFRWINPGRRTTTDYATNGVSEQNLDLQRVHKYGVVFKPLPSLSVFYSDSANFFPQSGVENPGTPFQYDRSDSLGESREGGVKFNVLDGKLYGSFSYFKVARTNVRTSVQVTFPDGSLRVVNAQRDNTTKGWEADIGSRLPLKSVGHLDTVLTYYDALSLTSRGLPADHAPTYMSTIVSKFTFTEGALRDLSAGGSFRNESQKTSFALWFDTPPVYGLFASYKFRKNWTAALNFDNITDERYLIEGVPASGLNIVGGSAEVSPPRQVKLTVGFNF